MLLPYFHKAKLTHYIVPQTMYFNQPEDKESNKFIDWLKGLKPPEECETIWDCDDGLFCCDFIIAKICCPGGMMSPIVDYVPNKEGDRVFN